MDLDKLKSIDWKSLDTEKLISLATEHQKPLVKIVLIAGALIMAGSMFNDYHAKDQAIRTQMSQAQEKIDVMKQRDAAIEDMKNFKASVPAELSESKLITLISQYAKLYQISIISLLPGISKDMGLYDILSVSFEATSSSFKNVMLFSRKIEKSKIPLRIDSWSGQEQQKGTIDFSVKVSAVLIHT